MDVWYLIMEIVMLLGAAFLLGALAQRLKQSPIVGYLLAGTLLGPIMFNKAAVQDIAELGVALLLFSIGLEFSFSRLKAMGTRAFIIGVLQITVTLTVFALIFLLRGSWTQSLAMGAIIALSSTAIVLRVLVDRAEIDATHGRNALAILLTQDAAVVPLVLMVAMLGRGGDMQGAALHIVKTLAAAGGLALVFYLIFYIAVPKALVAGGLFANRELVILLAITTAIGSAWAAHAIGLSPALGAFIAGMLLAECSVATQIRSDIGSLRTLFVTLFFTSIGMLANPAWFISNLAATLFWVVIVFAGKAMIIFIICILLRIDRRNALATGITLAQIGEFSFVLATEALRGNILTQNQFDLLVTVNIISMFLAPYMAAFAPLLARRAFDIMHKTRAPEQAGRDETPEVTSADHIYIIGFGPAGRCVADVLVENCLSAAVIELNPKSAAIAREKGLSVHMVDATSSDAMAHVGIKDACLVIVTVPDPRVAQEIIRNISFFAPAAMIIARSRYHIANASLKSSGATLVIDEETTVGNELAQTILETYRQRNRDALGCALAGVETQ